MLPIRCGSCNKWLLRVEGGYVYAVCPRCGKETRVKITRLIAEIDKLLQDLLAAANGGDVSVYTGQDVETLPRKTGGRPPRAFG